MGSVPYWFDERVFNRTVSRLPYDGNLYCATVIILCRLRYLPISFAYLVVVVFASSRSVLRHLPETPSFTLRPCGLLVKCNSVHGQLHHHCTRVSRY